MPESSTTVLSLASCACSSTPSMNEPTNAVLKSVSNENYNKERYTRESYLMITMLSYEILFTRAVTAMHHILEELTLVAVSKITSSKMNHNAVNVYVNWMCLTLPYLLKIVTLQAKLLLMGSILSIFEVSNIFECGWVSSKNWLVPKTNKTCQEKYIPPLVISSI